MIVVYDNFAAADENSLVKLGSAAVRAVREGHFRAGNILQAVNEANSGWGAAVVDEYSEESRESMDVEYDMLRIQNAVRQTMIRAMSCGIYSFSSPKRSSWL